MSARFLGILVWACLASVASRALAQEIADEHSEVRHVYDDAPPVWEAAADASVELLAPDELEVCRQGRVAFVGGIREAHMGCWPRRGADGGRRLEVPHGDGHLGVRRGLDIEWIGGAVTLNDGDILRIVPDDRTAIRVIGWTLTGAALATAVGLAIAMLTNALPGQAGEIVGFCIAGASVFLGLSLALLNDGIQFSVVRHTEPPS